MHAARVDSHFTVPLVVEAHLTGVGPSAPDILVGNGDIGNDLAVVQRGGTLDPAGCLAVHIGGGGIALNVAGQRHGSVGWNVGFRRSGHVAGLIGGASPHFDIALLGKRGNGRVCIRGDGGPALALISGNLQLGDRCGVVRGLHGGERSGGEPLAIACVSSNGNGRLRGISGRLVAVLHGDIYRHIALLAYLTGHAGDHAVGRKRTDLGIRGSINWTPNYWGGNGWVPVLHIHCGRQSRRSTGGGGHALRRSDCRRFAGVGADFPFSNGHGGIAAIHSLTGHVEL